MPSIEHTMAVYNKGVKALIGMAYYTLLCTRMHLINQLFKLLITVGHTNYKRKEGGNSNISPNFNFVNVCKAQFVTEKSFDHKKHF